MPTSIVIIVFHFDKKFTETDLAPSPYLWIAKFPIWRRLIADVAVLGSQYYQHLDGHRLLSTASHFFSGPSGYVYSSTQLSTTESTILPRPNQGAGTQRSGSAPQIPNPTATSPEKHSCRRRLGPTPIPASASHARRRLHRSPPFFLVPRDIARVPVFGYWVSFQFEIQSLIAL